MSSFLVDSNILIYAVDSTLPECPKAVRCLEKAGAGSATWAISWQNIYEFMSVVTHPKAFQGKPLSLKEAADFIGRVLEAPNIRLIQEGESHWRFFQEVVADLPGVYGAFLYDCRLAALLKEHEIAKIITADSGFKRFHFLKVENPFE